MENVGQVWCCMMKFNEIHKKKKGLQAIFRFQNIISRIFWCYQPQPCSSKLLGFLIWASPSLQWCDFRKPLQVAVRFWLQKTRIRICLPVNCPKRILQQFFEEIIHIQGGIKELNTKMLLLILSELLTVRREFSACLVFRAWWGSFLTVLVGVFKARSPTMLSFPTECGA